MKLPQRDFPNQVLLAYTILYYQARQAPTINNIRNGKSIVLRACLRNDCLMGFNHSELH